MAAAPVKQLAYNRAPIAVLDRVDRVEWDTICQIAVRSPLNYSAVRSSNDVNVVTFSETQEHNYFPDPPNVAGRAIVLEALCLLPRHDNDPDGNSPNSASVLLSEGRY
jgi:hypothetical protein